MDNKKKKIATASDIKPNEPIMLYNKTNKSNKFYKISIEWESPYYGESPYFVLYGTWGKINQKGTTQEKMKDKYLYQVQRKAYQLYKSKTQKGYTLTYPTATQKNTPNQKVDKPKEKEIPKEFKRFVALME